MLPARYLSKATKASFPSLESVRYSFPMLGLAIVAGLLSGCGSSGPVTAPVQGKVSFQGKPVTTGVIMFFPVEGRATRSSIQSDGTYKLQGGALIGSHKVTIKATKIIDAPPQPKSYEEEVQGVAAGTKPSHPRVKWLVPQTYYDRNTTPLEAEVVAGEENVIDFNLFK